MRKTFIIDTSVLLYDKCSIHSFPDSDLVIPIVVLDELDRFKEKPGLLGENARYVNRFLDELRSKGSLHKGITIDNGQTIRVELLEEENVPSGLDPLAGDNRIISVARHISKEVESVIVVTKDINFRVKCDAINIPSEDYYKDRIVTSENQIYTGQKIVNLKSQEIIDKFYKDGEILISDVEEDCFPNQLVIGKFEKQSFLGITRKDKIVPLRSDLLKDTISVSARNKEQKFALDLLTRDDIPLVTLTGLAGSGKTFLTLMAALSGLHGDKYERIIVTRTIQPVGKEIGFLPGTIKEKMDPWIAPILDNFRHAFKDITYFEAMRDKGHLEVAPLAFIRGRTFNNSFLIVDEAQNATIHELKTIITRAGEGSKIVLLGDIDQIDTPYIDSLSNGLTIVIEKLKSSNLTGHITLMKGERSELATLASKAI